MSFESGFYHMFLIAGPVSETLDLRLSRVFAFPMLGIWVSEDLSVFYISVVEVNQAIK